MLSQQRLSVLKIRRASIAVRNAASQVGIATVAAVAAYVFGATGFSAVALISAIATLLIPICCIWIREPRYSGL
jgi:predicted MFS family arabinose efflux permease